MRRTNDSDAILDVDIIVATSSATSTGAFILSVAIALGLHVHEVGDVLPVCVVRRRRVVGCDGGDLLVILPIVTTDSGIATVLLLLLLAQSFLAQELCLVRLLLLGLGCRRSCGTRHAREQRPDHDGDRNPAHPPTVTGTPDALNFAGATKRCTPPVCIRCWRCRFCCICTIRVERFGAKRIVDFTHPDVDRAVKAVGWERLCTEPTERARAAFIAAFRDTQKAESTA